MSRVGVTGENSASKSIKRKSNDKVIKQIVRLLTSKDMFWYNNESHHIYMLELLALGTPITETKP